MAVMATLFVYEFFNQHLFFGCTRYVMYQDFLYFFVLLCLVMYFDIFWQYIVEYCMYCIMVVCFLRYFV